MKRALLIAVVLLLSSVAFSEEKKSSVFQFPNLEGSVFYSMPSKTTLTGATSKILEYQLIEGRVGYLETNKLLGAVTIKVSSLLKKVNFAWEDILKTSTVGAWYANKDDYGFMATLIDIEFK